MKDDKLNRSSYTKTEDKYIIEHIVKNPGNISKSCRELGEMLNRNPKGISMRWYKLSKTELNKSFIIFGKNKHLINRKNTNISKHHTISLWNAICKMFK